MRESWRWFGPNDPVTLAEIRQTGATDIVSALHDIPIGEAWPVEAIRAHKALIEADNDTRADLCWSVVESIPVHEDIKLAAPGHEKYIDNWITTLTNLAAEGITTICYNFMPVIDWTRTDLRYQMPSGALARYRDMDHAALRAKLVAFLARVLPHAERAEIDLAIHPDDLPWDMFDLPQMALDFAERIHFAHLRGVTRDVSEQRSFIEANHLDSDIDMVRVIAHLLKSETTRGSEIFIRPDHGHLMMGDVNKTSNPGYSAIGRMKGLAEIRGVITALSTQME